MTRRSLLRPLGKASVIRVLIKWVGRGNHTEPADYLRSKIRVALVTKVNSGSMKEFNVKPAFKRI